MTTTAISAVVTRTHTMLAGQVVAVTARLRPWVRCNVELFVDGPSLIMLNPVYEFVV